MSTIIFTGGGTGGHVYPGLAVWSALPTDLRSRVVWVGSRRGVERDIVAREGIPYRAVPTGKLRRYLDVQNVLDLFRVLAGVLAARRLLRRLDAGVVFSKGGFVAVPVVLAARSLGIPVVIHESDADPGLATRITAPCATRIFVPYRETADGLSARLRRRITVSGNPVRAAFRTADVGTALPAVGLTESDLPVILVTGGSLGALQINRLVAETIGELSARAVVIHQTGAHSADMIPTIRGAAVAGRYHGAPTFLDAFPALMRRADLVVARAGAGTIWEIASCGRPAVLIPLSYGASRGDQIRNAHRYGRSGAAVVLSDPDLDAAAFLLTIGELMDDAPRRHRMGAAAARGAGGNAAETIAAAVAGLYVGAPERYFSGHKGQPE